MYYPNPQCGSGSIQVCLCEDDVSLVLADCTMKRAFSLYPDREGELYITWFHKVSGYRNIDGKKASLCPGRVYISDCMSGIRQTTFDAGRRIVGFLLVIRTKAYARHLARLLHMDCPLSFSSLTALDQKVESAAISAISRSLFHFRGDDISSRLFYEGKTAEIMSLLLSSHPRHRAGREEHCESVRQYVQEAEIDRIVQYMSAHLSDPLTTEEIALRFSSSPSRLSSMFKRSTAHTLSEYRNQLRVAEARRLLTETNLTQEEIASRVGFSRVSNFSDFFRRMTGEAPGALRKRKGRAAVPEGAA